MNLKALFSKKSTSHAAAKTDDVRLPDTKLDLDVLDTCVGGRTDIDGVGCYARSTQPRVH